MASYYHEMKMLGNSALFVATVGLFAAVFLMARYSADQKHYIGAYCGYRAETCIYRTGTVKSGESCPPQWTDFVEYVRKLKPGTCEVEK